MGFLLSHEPRLAGFLLLLRLLLFLLLLIPRFSAVLDFGQEFADALDVFLGPEMDSETPGLRHFRRWNLAQANMFAEAART